jgi:RimJ/RimL family protein N-acetyltransferase
MSHSSPILSGRHVRLEPLDSGHLAGLVAAAAEDPALYLWSLVPQGLDQIKAYVEAALAMRDASTALPFAIVRAADGQVLGSTRLFWLERWAWPPGHARHGRAAPDAGEIGYTWLGASAVRTAANTEAKLLLLGHAFDSLQMLRVCFHTDVRNERSRAAIERIGGRFEGLLRAHRMASDYIARDSCRYSIVAAEWPLLQPRLAGMLERG